MIWLAASLHRKTAKDAELFDGDELFGDLGGQENVADHSFLGDAARAGLIGNLFFNQRRQHVAGADGIASDAVLSGFEGDGAG